MIERTPNFKLVKKNEQQSIFTENALAAMSSITLNCM